MVRHLPPFGIIKKHKQRAITWCWQQQEISLTTQRYTIPNKNIKGEGRKHEETSYRIREQWVMVTEEKGFWKQEKREGPGGLHGVWQRGPSLHLRQL